MVMDLGSCTSHASAVGAAWTPVTPSIARRVATVRGTVVLFLRLA